MKRVKSIPYYLVNLWRSRTLALRSNKPVEPLMLQHTPIGKFLSKLLVAAFFLGAIQFVNADAGYAWKTPAPITLKGDSLTTTYGTSDSMTVSAQGGYPGYTFSYSTPIDGVTFEQTDSATVAIKVSETATPGVYQEVITATDYTTVQSDPQTFNITILKADRHLTLAVQKPILKFGEKINVAAYVNSDVPDAAKAILGSDGNIQFTTDSSTACSIEPGTGNLNSKNNTGNRGAWNFREYLPSRRSREAPPPPGLHL